MNTPSKPLADHDTLLEAIGSALAAPQPNIETLFGLVGQAAQLATVSRRHAEEATARTLDPATKASELSGALVEAQTLKLTAARLERAVELCEGAIAEASDKACDAAKLAAYEHAEAEQRRMADRIRKDYPELIAPLLAFQDDNLQVLECIWAVNRDLPPGKNPIHGPDGTARGFSDIGPNDGSAQSVGAIRIAQMVLPHPRRANGVAWPMTHDGMLQAEGKIMPMGWIMAPWRSHQAWLRNRDD